MRDGYTLVELLLVLAIVAVVGILSVPLFSRSLTQSSVANTSDQLVQSIRKAQFYSMVSRKDNLWGWGVNYGSFVITLYQGQSYGSRNQALDEKFNVSDSLTISGLTDLNFTRLTGIPSSGSFPMTITVSGLGSSKTITVNGQGVVSR